MALPAPNLDDRTFQQIVDDAKRQIGLRCPEWTDHNVSDPGVTLIELFAWMTEMTLFRLNQVPERNYIKFLEMIGVSLEPASPARLDLRFTLSRPIADLEGEEGFESLLRARETVAATVRTETQEAVEFATDSDLRLVRPRVAYRMAIPAPESGMSEEETALRHARLYEPVRPSFNDEQPPTAFPLFSPVPRVGDCFYIGFEPDVSGHLIGIQADGVPAAATGLDEDYPSQVWETWDGLTNTWERLEVPADSTFGFNRVGEVQLALPHGLIPRVVGGRRAYWVRCRYTTDPVDVPPRPNGKRAAVYQSSPEIRYMLCRTLGGTAPASNCTTVMLEELGQSDGLPGQIFTLRNRGILPRRPGETLLVGAQGQPSDALEEWMEVGDFADSGPGDRHFTLDAATGEIALGPNIVQPDGTTRQHGAIPAKGLTLYFRAYRFGGGTRGNVRENQVRVLKSSIPFIADVTNPRRADGGRDVETVDRAKLRGRALLRQQERAVTAEDFEILARRASAGVGRARCVSPRRVYSAGENGENILPGVVRVLITPALDPGILSPRPRDLHVPERTLREVRAYLDERRLLTTVLEVGEPDYLYVTTDITLVADPRADSDQVAARVRETLQRFLHPLFGGPTGDGWPFRRSLTLADVYAQVQAASGVAFLLDARIFISRVINPVEGLLGPEQPVSAAEGVLVGENELLCSREHRIRLKPIWAVGQSDNPEANP